MEHDLPVTNPCWAFENRLFSSMCFTSLSLFNLLINFPGTDVNDMGL